MSTDMTTADVKSKDDKFALFKKFQQHKGALFARITKTVSKQAKDEKKEEIQHELTDRGHKLKLENQLLELQVQEKQLDNQLLDLQIEEKQLDIKKKKSDSNAYG
ncbi:hypothetical protein Ddc_19247 [Ditylenchus destructor]|nr:hypothetical protein Ddc_19247 [Ditylenchus destructor]